MIILYNVRFLYLISVLCTATLSVLRTDQIQFGICKEGKDDLRLSQISLSQCIQNCLYRKECLSLNYERKLLLCRQHTENSTMCNCKTAGFIYSAKINWDKEAPAICSLCQPFQTCQGTNSTLQTQCSFTECQMPRNLSDGWTLGNQRHVGSRIYYTCRQGYDLYGPSFTVCQDNGRWSDAESICCPNGWLRFERSCYKFDISQRLTFDEARFFPVEKIKVNPGEETSWKIALKKGMAQLIDLLSTQCQQLHQSSKLVFIESAAEDKFIEETLEQLNGIKTDPRWEFYWLSLVLVGNVWKTVETNSSVSWLNWLPTEPNDKNGEENCGSAIYSPHWLSWGWNDISCEGKLFTICEIDRN